MAKRFEIKQKMWSLGGKFTIKDELGLPAYEVTGSFFQIPKTFTIADTQGRLVSKIEKKILTFLPQFTVTLATGQSFTIKKEWTFFKPKYTISGLGMTVQGDFWDMNFTLKQAGQTIAKIRQEWLRMTSTYQVEVYEDSYADLVTSLVIAIDYVKEQEATAANSSTTSH
ncbi:LURP-one-related/scramblase family protein [Streptococcus merionis]|uniref:LURP-one-related/scramblase family protein n=1 Tax=Streptococcus merionis TaxID=400065 RepID=UPI0026F0C69B|nr:LURP-one-related family protein [Streptococcus merionis]